MPEHSSRACNDRSRGGRPSRTEAAAIDRRILDSALKCFLAKGFADVTMEGVAQSAGVTKATLYLRHPDKLSLFWKVLEDRQAAWGAASRRRDHLLGTALEQRLTYYAQTLLAGSLNPEVRALMKLIDGYWGSEEAALKSFRDRLRSGMTERLTREIADSAKTGPAIADPRKAALAFVGILSGLATHLDEAPSRAKSSVELAATYAVNVFLHGRSSW